MMIRLNLGTAQCISAASRFGVLLLALICSCGVYSRTPEVPLANLYEQVARTLAAGGAAVYFVPVATTGVDQTDTPDWWKHCPLSKSVSVEGQRQAAAVHKAFRTLGLSMHTVESGVHCASLTTATFISGNSTKIYPNLDLDPLSVQKMTGISDGAIKSHVASHLTTTYFNSVKILSGMRMTRSTAPNPILTELEEGESAVFSTDANGQPVLVARLAWYQWEEMAKYIDRAARKTLRAGKTKLR
jgi:hypothetical protein